jgi:hypothetical protein
MNIARWPHGMDEVKAFFGDPYGYLIHDGQGISEDWSRDILARLALPAPLTLWDGKKAESIWCHKRVLSDLGAILWRIHDSGLWLMLNNYGGCFCWRAQRGGFARSLHSWGAAVDFRIHTCERGTDGDMPLAIVEVFEEHGWTWGGRWIGSSCDPMHLQAASGC